MAKFGIALGSGPRGLGFESRHSDQKTRIYPPDRSLFFVSWSLWRDSKGGALIDASSISLVPAQARALVHSAASLLPTKSSILRGPQNSVRWTVAPCCNSGSVCAAAPLANRLVAATPFCSLYPPQAALANVPAVGESRYLCSFKSCPPDRSLFFVSWSL